MSARVLRLPERGTLIVGTDLQGNLKDFGQLVRHFQQAGPEAWLVLTGDLVHGPDDETFEHWPDYLGTRYRDQSAELAEAFAAEQRAAPGRVHCLLGNHDHAHIGGPTTAKFHDDERAALEAQLDEPARLRLRELIRSFPLVAVGSCGVVLTHAAPAAAITSAADLETVQLDGYSALHFSDFIAVPVVGPLLWARMARPEQSQRFLSALGGTISLYGHDIVRDGYTKESTDQLCFSTSFGLHDEDKVYVELDLATRYPDVSALREGIELKKLWHD